MCTGFGTGAKRGEKMVNEIIVAAGFIILTVLLTLQFNKLTKINESKLNELSINILEWKKQMEQQQENFQSSLINHAKQVNTALIEVMKDANYEMLNLLEKEKESRDNLLQKVADVQGTAKVHLEAQKKQIEVLASSNMDVVERLVQFIDETKQVATTTQQFHQQISVDFSSFTTSMHNLFDTKVKEQHDLLLKSEHVINESLQSIVHASDSNLEKYEKAIQEITTIQNAQSQLVLLMKRAQEEHHQKIESYQEEMKEGLDDVFNEKLDAINDKFIEQNIEVQAILAEIKDEIHDMVNSVSGSQKVTESTYHHFETILNSLDDSLKQTIFVTQTMQTEMKALGEKDIQLLEKILR
jgi:hypothetical protein